MRSSDQTTALSMKTAWHQINWAKAQKHVRHIQFKIMKAYETGNRKRARALQRLLARSFSAKVLAVRKVTSNDGKSTPGVDGQLWNMPEKKWQAVQQLNRGKYRAKPLRRVEIPKANGKTRPLGIPVMYDRAMQVLWGQALEPIAERAADLRSYGFRRYRSAHDAIENLWNSHCKGTAYVLDADIKGCFDNISHQWLIKHIPMDKQILRQWLNCGVIIAGKYYPTTKGTPQGGPISPMLANLTLDGLEQATAKAAHLTCHGYTQQSHWGHYQRSGLHVIRYADDFIVTAKRAEYLTEAIGGIKQFLAERGLELNEQKTSLGHIDQGYQFLGFHLRRYADQKVIIKPTADALKSVKTKVSQIVREMIARTQDDLILGLRPVTLGWCQYYQTVCSQRAFEKLDNHVFKRLWWWAQRRHKRKSARWIKNRYWRVEGKRKWNFVTGQTRLPQCEHIPIIRVKNLRIKANIFIDETYFKQRSQDLAQLRMSRREAQLLSKQNGYCPMCKGVLQVDDQTNLHHIQPKLTGGRNDIGNLMLVHANCHQSYHATHYARRT
ncbi:RNA-directed DNA polymerase [Dyadobacter psychrophilus]|uniref:RNA-directed DNA polymerase n=2 Tax=Dyadobacter psychrophilus TaxID=651661 RepID=A0A1T5HGF0_9BACT|nr:RNA-directed DNA polymerase [Dyadobacter psychrophilus]